MVKKITSSKKPCDCRRIGTAGWHPGSRLIISVFSVYFHILVEMCNCTISAKVERSEPGRILLVLRYVHIHATDVSVMAGTDVSVLSDICIRDPWGKITDASVILVFRIRLS
jgi:hypothetical protein